MAVTVQQLTQLYLAYFGRPPDFDGVQFYTANPAANVNTVAAAFSASPESQALYGTSFGSAQINAIYRNLFNREAEPAGLAYWAQEVAAGRLTAAGAAYGILVGAKNDDLTAVNNKLTIATAFYNALDTAAEITGYSGNAAAATARNFLATVSSDAATVTAAQTNLTAQVAAATAQGGAVGTTFTLTTGTDTLVGTAGNDRFVADAATQIQATDTINGGAGNDTFEVIGFQGGGAAVVGQTEASVVAFSPLVAGEFITVAGLTLTATGAVTAAEVAQAFGGATNANITRSGTLSGWTVGNVTGGSATFTSTTPNTNVVDLVNSISTNDATAPVTAASVTTTQGAAGTAATTATTLPALTSIETLTLSGALGDTAVNLAAYSKAATGVENIVLTNVAALNGKTITTGNGQSLSLATGSGAATAGAVTWQGSNTDASQSLTLNGYQGAAAAPSDLTILGTAATSLTLASTGAVPTGSTAANKVGTLTTAAANTKVTINAASAVEITNVVGANVAEIDASASTAGVTVGVNGTAGNLKFTGGAGNDTVIFGATNTFTTLDTVDGGAGANTLGVARAQAANTTTAFTNIKNFATLRVTGDTTNADVFNLDHFGATNIRFDGQVAQGEARTVTNIGSGATLTVVAGAGTGTGSTNLTIKNDGADDSLTIAARGAAGTFTVNASQFEKITVNTSALTGAATLALTDALLKELTLVNTTAAGTNPDVAVNLGTLGAVVSKVDFSAFKAATATNGVTVTLSNAAVNGATVLGSGNNDIINGSSQNDTITAGNGADTITGGAGNDTIILTETTAAIDTVVFSTAATNGTDIIRGFDVGTAGVDVAQLRLGDTTAGTANGVAAVLTQSTASLVTGGAAYTTSSSTNTSDVIEITTTLDSTVTLSATSTGADLLQALSSDTTAASGITASSANDAAFFVVYQNNNAYLFHGDANGGGVSGTLIEANEIRLVGVFEGIATGAFVTGDFVMIT